MTTTYGTIPTSSNDTNVAYVVSHAKHGIKSGLGTRRPWKEMVFFSMPEHFPESLSRIQTNVSYFHTNYVIIILIVLFLNLLWFPVSLVVFTVLMAAWLFLYFLRDDPIIIMGYVVDDRLVSAVLSVVTVVVLLSARASVVIVGLVVGTAVVLLHAAFGQTDDLIFDEEHGRVDLKETASSSYSSSM